MAHKRKDTFVTCAERRKHLKYDKRVQAKAERRFARNVARVLLHTECV